MTGYSPRRRGSILSDMADIAQDLWASVPETVPAEKPTAVRDEPTAPHAPQTAQNPAKSADSAPKATYADEKSLPFTELWKVADEPIDWTEVLSSPIPTDGLVSAEKWALYRQYADKVLSGDTAAYLGVLKAVDPMGDLAPYTSSLSVATRDADVMLATFAVRDDLLDSDGAVVLAGLGSCGEYSRYNRSAPLPAGVFVARKGKKPLASGVRLISAHTDAPRLDFKQRPLQEQVGIGQAKTHYYGGIRKYQWLARPLALHGVIIKEDGTSIKVVLGEDPGDPVFTIADLLPHLAQKEVTKTVADAFDAEKLNVILGHSPLPSASDTDETAKEQKDPVRANILALLNRKYGIREEDLMSAELQAVPAGPARYVGLDAALIGGYGQDDRVCVFTALSAFLDAQAPEHANCLIFWDKEEIGSEGSTGAQGRFLEYCMEDLTEAWEPGTKVRDVFQNSTAVSGDVHAATDPDWQELHEKLNASIIGHGPTFCKFTGSRGKYGANDAHPEYIGWLRGVLNRKNIPWQMAELGKVDHGGGGTVALYLAAYGMDTIDLGPAVLSMHSPFELLSKADLYSTKLAYQAILEA